MPHLIGEGSVRGLTPNWLQARSSMARVRIPVIQVAVSLAFTASLSAMSLVEIIRMS
jgi:hypothetical protein